MSTSTEILAREIVQLEKAISAAARARAWYQCAELDELREHMLTTRLKMIREEFEGSKYEK